MRNQLFDLHIQRIHWVTPRFDFIDSDGNEIYHIDEHEFEIKYNRINLQVTCLYELNAYCDIEPYIYIYL